MRSFVLASLAAGARRRGVRAEVARRRRRPHRNPPAAPAAAPAPAPAPAPPPAVASAPPAAAPATPASAPAAADPFAQPAAPGAGGGRGGRGNPPPPPTPPPSVMPAPVTPIVSATAPTPDPRVGLAPGRWDAAQAAWNMRLVSTTPPAEKFLGVTNSDLAFTGKYAIQGNYNGFQVFDISNPAKPSLVLTYVCPASQSDVSVYKNLLFVSGEGQTGRVDCGIQGVPEPVSKDRLRGIRVFDIVRHRESEVRHQRADLPRLAHAHRRDRSERQGERLHLRVRFVRRAVGGRAAGLQGWPDRRSGQRALPPRGDQGAARRAAEGGDRELAAHLLRPRAASAARRARPRRTRADAAATPRQRRRAARRRARLARRIRRRHPRPRRRRQDAARAAGAATAVRISATTSRCIPTSVSPAAPAAATGCCSTSGMSRTRSASIRRPTSTCRSGTRRRSATTAARSCSPTNGAAARSRAAATPTSPSGAPTRSSRSRTARCSSRATTRCRRRRPRSRTAWRTTARSIPIPGREVMVQGWYQGGISVFDWTDLAKPKEIAFFDRGPLDPTRVITADRGRSTGTTG